MDREERRDCYIPEREVMFHDHEVLGSTHISYEEYRRNPHNHRYAAISSQAICERHGHSHFHIIETHTDFFEDHSHKIRVKTGPAIPVGDGRHTHFVESATSVNDEHCHKFQLALAIEDPIGEKKHHHHKE